MVNPCTLYLGWVQLCCWFQLPVSHTLEAVCVDWGGYAPPTETHMEDLKTEFQISASTWSSTDHHRNLNSNPTDERLLLHLTLKKKSTENINMLVCKYTILIPGAIDFGCVCSSESPSGQPSQMQSSDPTVSTQLQQAFSCRQEWCKRNARVWVQLNNSARNVSHEADRLISVSLFMSNSCLMALPTFIISKWNSVNIVLHNTNSLLLPRRASTLSGIKQNTAISTALQAARIQDSVLFSIHSSLDLYLFSCAKG